MEAPEVGATPGAASLQAGIAAARAGERATARSHFAAVLQQHPRDDTAWLWLSTVVDEVAQAIECVERVLRRQPHHPWARERRAHLAVLALLPAPVVATPPLTMPPPFRLGAVVEQLGFATAAEVAAAVDQQQQAPFGQRLHLGALLLDAGILTPDQLTTAIGHQIRLVQQDAGPLGFRQIGYYLLAGERLTPFHLAETMTHQAVLRYRQVVLPVGELLLYKKLARQRDVAAALDQQRQDYDAQFRTTWR